MAATIVVVCPFCKNKTRASAQHAGKRGKCPKCQKLIDINPSGQESLTSLAPEDSAAPGRGMAAAGIQNSAWLAAAIALGATVVLYLLVFMPLRGTYIGDLMCERGPVQYELVFVTSWGLALLGLRYLAVKRELRTTDMELQLIPLEIGMQITPNNVEQFLGHVGKLPPAQLRSVLARRLRGALEHFKHRSNVSEVQTYLSSQAQLDSSAVDSGYTLVRVFIWLCPILGFIGTVTGISDAVTGLATSLPKAEAVAAADLAAPQVPAAEAKGDDKGGLSGRLLTGMGMVTDGLAKAFDTTLLGLLCVCILMFPFEYLKRIEYSVLDRVEDFTNESLVRRLAEDEGGGAKDEMPELVRRTLEAAFREHQRWLGDWQAQVRQLGQLIGADFEGAVARVVDKVSQAEGGNLREIQRAAKAVDELFHKLTTSGPSADVLDRLEKLSRAMVEHNSIMSSLVAQQKPTELYQTGIKVQPGALDAYGTVAPDTSMPKVVPVPDNGGAGPQKKGIFSRIFGG